MKLYSVTLQADEREELEAITHKDSHPSQKVINALILLNCDEEEFNDHHTRGEDVANILRISMRKIDRVKKHLHAKAQQLAQRCRDRTPRWPVKIPQCWSLQNPPP